MKTKALVVALALCCFAAATSFAGSECNMGTWKLNAKKSKIAAGMGRNHTVVYDSGIFGKVKVTVDGVDAKGKPTHNEWSGRFDGQDYKVTGDADSDMRAYAQGANDHTLNMTQKKGGKVVATGQIVVSPDGKMRTVTTMGTGAKGKRYKSVAVYNKA